MTENKKETKEITTFESGLSILNSKDFKLALEQEKERRKILQDYISSQLKEDIDYGKIEMTSKKTGKTYTTKPVLLKSGGEKFISLLRLQPPEWSEDEETLRMLPEAIKAKGVLAYKCVLKNHNGVKVSEGRGACSLAEWNYDLNKAVKITKKRAMIDAVLGLGLSDAFTQDLEDDSVVELPKINDIMTFGKHKGKKYSEAPIDYLKYLRDNAYTEEGAINMQKIMDEWEKQNHSVSKEEGAKITEQVKKETKKVKGNEFESPIDDTEELPFQK